MYKLLTIEDTVRIPPKKFNAELVDVIKTEFEGTYNGRIVKNVGVILAVIDVKNVSEGKIIMGDGAVYYESKLEILAYQPNLNEVVEGSVTELAEFGAFVNFGPFDGLIHLSQVTEDFMSYDAKNAVLIGKETRKTLKIEDDVRARMVAISMKRTLSDSKIGLTMRQPYLGKTEWIEEKRREGDDKKKASPKGKEGHDRRGKRRGGSTPGAGRKRRGGRRKR